MMIRKYLPPDCESLAVLFYETVHTVNAKDYTKEQLDAWADGQMDLAAWDRAFQAHHTLVAVEEDSIVGFADMDGTGYLDRLFVHKDHQGEGIASSLCEQLEAAFDGPVLRTHASITARPFFEKQGYRVVRKRQVKRHGVLLTNYLMEKRR